MKESNISSNCLYAPTVRCYSQDAPEDYHRQQEPVKQRTMSATQQPVPKARRSKEKRSVSTVEPPVTTENSVVGHKNSVNREKTMPKEMLRQEKNGAVREEKPRKEKLVSRDDNVVTKEKQSRSKKERRSVSTVERPVGMKDFTFDMNEFMGIEEHSVVREKLPRDKNAPENMPRREKGPKEDTRIDKGKHSKSKERRSVSTVERPVGFKQQAVPTRHRPVPGDEESDFMKQHRLAAHVEKPRSSKGRSRSVAVTHAPDLSKLKQAADEREKRMQKQLAPVAPPRAHRHSTGQVQQTCRGVAIILKNYNTF